MADNIETWPKNYGPPEPRLEPPGLFSIWWHVESKACKSATAMSTTSRPP
ncbi:Hypothetical protein FKW44_006618 [Caligus rogercresseyi]|uniref:Uncharacterized protein n=1 Tax=Caligus rogercresseyi TaxID=217165 RepID=A0A7T8QT03_CALRO|nr:Hypothetical protein FKW44_006618 [Caligus rogercresseyi]